MVVNPKPPRPSPPRYKKADVDRKVLDVIVIYETVRGKPITWRELMVATGYGMWVLTESVKRLRAAGLVIPGVPGRRGFLVAVKEVK
jgi:hypothetical protein